MDPLSIAASAAQNVIVQKSLEVAGATIQRNSDKIAKRVMDRAIAALQIGFGDYLYSSYEKCRFFKSILPPSQPREVILNYVNVDLRLGDETISDDALVDSIPFVGSFVITGLAGSGKSMLLKYLTVRHFEQPRGVIPLFIELRKLNSLTDKNLISFVRSSCSSASNSVSSDQFDIALRAGAFCLILDGFDELSHENREIIQEQILNLKILYPRLCVVVSSRPDDRFNGWSAFKTYRVRELSKNQCLTLIDSFDYDVGIKRRFKKEVSSSLFDSHTSFLSFPLLVSIMLLTFEEFAEIPNKKHVFYRQAFDTLFQKHDASKEQYKRKIKTGLQLEEFRLHFAAFCAFSYLDELYSFDDDALIEKAELSARYIKNSGDSKSNINSKDFINDLFEAVCMLQKDGLETAFVHRSFQEYFSAVFATRLPADKMMKVLDNFSQRQADSPVGMAFDMAREVVESGWVAPTIRRLIGVLGDESLTHAERFGKFIDHMAFFSDETTVRFALYAHKEEMLSTLESICKLYSEEIGRRRIVKFAEKLDKKLLANNLLIEENATNKNYEEIAKLLSGEFSEMSNFPHVLVGKGDEWWFESFGGNDCIDGLVSSLSKVLRSIELREKRRGNIIGDLL